MKYNRRYRKSIRLRDYDYSQCGAYFVTICTNNRLCLLSNITDEKLVLSEYGIIIQNTWDELQKHYHNIDLDMFVIMPNHIHGIIFIIDNPVGAGFKPAPEMADNPMRAGLKPAPTKRHGLPEIVRAFKTFSARLINEIKQATGQPFWQRNYYEHIIRNDKELYKIREYIHNNPLKWELDRENPKSKNFNLHHDIYWKEIYGR